MKNTTNTLRPKERLIIEHLGENIKLARLRRKLTMQQIAERANISRKTLWHIEKGSPHIGIGNILKTLSVLGLADELLQIAKDDVFGRKIQDAGLINK